MTAERPGFRSVILPFIIFTAIWGSTWIVIRDQLGDVPAHWSVAYRFGLATLAMAVLTLWRGEGLRLPLEGSPRRPRWGSCSSS